MTDIERLDPPVREMGLARTAYQPQPMSAHAKHELTRIASEHRRRKGGMESGAVLTLEGARAIAGIWEIGHRMTVSSMGSMAERSERYEGRPGYGQIAQFSYLAADRFGGQQLNHLERGSAAVSNITTDSMDLDADTRGPIKRWYEGEKR